MLPSSTKTPITSSSKFVESLHRNLIHAQTSHATREEITQSIYNYTIGPNLATLISCNNKDAIKQFIQVFCACTNVITEKQAVEITQLIFQKIYLISTSTKEKTDLIINLLVKNLINKSHYSVNAATSLHALMAFAEFIPFAKKTVDIDQLLIDALNSRALCEKDSSSYYEPYVRLIREITLAAPKRLTGILSSIDFFAVGRTNSHELSRVFYRIFISESTNATVSKSFFNAIADSMTAQCFRHPDVVDSEDKLLSLLGSMFSVFASPTGKNPAENLIQQLITMEKNHFPEGRFPLHELFTTMVFTVSHYKPGILPSLSYMRILFHIGISANSDQQHQFAKLAQNQIENAGLLTKQTNDIKNANGLPLLVELSQKLQNITDYYTFPLITQDETKNLPKTIIEKIISYARLNADHSKNGNVRDMIRNVIGVIADFKAVPKDYLRVILKKADPIGHYKNGIEAFIDCLGNVCHKSDIEKWETEALADQIFMVYSTLAFPIKDYHQWFSQFNKKNNKTSSGVIRGAPPKTIFPYNSEHPEEIANLKKGLLGYLQLPKLGYHFLHHSQLAAVRCAIEQPEGFPYIFQRMGTGQGKSLVIALIALHYAKNKNKPVHIFTAYDHLAKRDYNRFKDFFKQFGVTSYYIDPDLTEEEEAAETAFESPPMIIYAELQTYMIKIMKSVKNTALNTKAGHDLSLLNQNAVAILDEFDAIFEYTSAFQPHIHNFSAILTFDGMTETIARDGAQLKAYIKQQFRMNDFFEALHYNNLTEITNNWFSRKGDKESSTEPNPLGRADQNFAKGYKRRLWEDKACKTYSIETNLLQFIKNHTRVIGLTGSVTADSMNQYKQVFGGYLFYNIPPFFGPTNNLFNKRIDWSKHCPPGANRLEKIKQDIDKALMKGQPVLIFHDEKDPNTALVRAYLNEKTNISSGIMPFSDEKQVNKENLKKACEPKMLSWATRIVGRGADFVIPEQTKHAGGLHVLIISLPVKPDGSLDENMIIQMLGRAARWLNPGSGSIIPIKPEFYPVSEIKLKIRTEKARFHDLLLGTYQKLEKLPYNKAIWQRWILINHMLRQANDYPATLENKSLADQITLFSQIIINPKDTLPQPTLDEPLTTSTNTRPRSNRCNLL